MNVQNKLLLREGLRAGGALIMWEQILLDALPEMKRLVPDGSNVLEVGYGDGLLTCFLAKELGWKITGIDISSEAYNKALQNAINLNLSDRVNFLLYRPDDTKSHKGQYDAVFIKTVIYHSKDLQEYSRWLEWINSVLKARGILINFETGRANWLMQLYRKLRGREYANWCLYRKEIESLYDEKFDILYRKYYAGLSQFVALIPKFYKVSAKIECSISPRNAGNCFAVAIIAQKKNGGI